MKDKRRILASGHKQELKRPTSAEPGENEVAGPEMKQLEQKRKIMQRSSPALTQSNRFINQA